MTRSEIAGLVCALLAVALFWTAFGLMKNGWRGAIGMWVVVIFALGGFALGFAVCLRFRLLVPPT